MVEIDPALSADTPLTRYMPFSKFMDLIECRRVFLSSVASFRSSDRYEGSLPFLNEIHENGSMAALAHFANNVLPSALGTGERPAREPSPPPPTFQSLFGPIKLAPPITITDVLASQARWVDVQCWHQNSRESMAMWKVYGGAEPSVAISTTVQKLADSMTVASPTTVLIAPVRYIDFATEYFDTKDPRALFLHKFDAFAYEQEVRVLAHDPGQDATADRQLPGRYIDCDLSSLFTGIRVSPNAQDWFFNLVDRIGRNAVGIEAQRSAI